MNPPPAAESLWCLSYTSRTTRGWHADDLTQLVAAAARHNARHAISGRLLCLDRRFIQVLEGPQHAVAALIGRIKADRRHFDVRVIVDSPILQRTFTAWGMDAAVRADLMDTPLARELEALPQAARDTALAGIATSFVHRALRVTPLQRRAQETTSSLLAAAQRVAVHQGLDGATMQAIAEEAGVGIKSAYRYFSSPADMFRLLVRQRQLRLFGAFRAWLAEAHFTDAADLARQIVIYSAGDYLGDTRLPDVILRLALREFHDIAFAELRELAADVVAAMRRGGLQADDPGLHGRIAAALGGLGGAAKMAGLHDRDLLRGVAFVDMLSAPLEMAMLGSPRN